MKKDSLSPYKRLQVELAALISNTPTGDRLPSEPTLAKTMGVSRATLREAMRTFEGQGLVRRKQGIGTFVVGNSRFFETGLEVLESIETLAAKIHLPVTMGNYSQSQIVAEGEMAAALGIEVGTPLLRISRVILVERRPVAYLIDTLPLDVFPPGDLEKNFTGSVLDLLIRKGSFHLANSRTEIHAIAAASEVARALEIQRGDVLLSFEADLFTTEGRVIDHSFSYFLPGYFHFHVIRSIGPAMQEMMPENK